MIVARDHCSLSDHSAPPFAGHLIGSALEAEVPIDLEIKAQLGRPRGDHSHCDHRCESGWSRAAPGLRLLRVLAEPLASPLTNLFDGEDPKLNSVLNPGWHVEGTKFRLRNRRLVEMASELGVSGGRARHRSADLTLFQAGSPQSDDDSYRAFSCRYPLWRPPQ